MRIPCAADRVLYLIATPIGNVADISLRALEVLARLDVLASEDTRKTGMLLARHGIKARQMSFHEHNERAAGQKIMGLLAEGKDVGLVTDAGTPGISDPGYSIVHQALAAGVPISMLPGPSAFVMAVVLSGLPVHSFTFRGFPPRRSGPRRRFYAEDAASPHTLVFYESPYRLAASLEDALAVYGDRRCALANDLTKHFESVERGLLSAALATVRDQTPKGEFTLVIEGLPGAARSADETLSTPQARIH